MQLANAMAGCHGSGLQASGDGCALDRELLRSAVQDYDHRVYRNDLFGRHVRLCCACSVVFAAVTIGIPQHGERSLVGGMSGLALAHAFEAAYIARTIVSPITSGFKRIHDGISGSEKAIAPEPATVRRAPCKTY